MRSRYAMSSQVPRIFFLYRREDATGISGTGFVAEGVRLSNGKVVMGWRGGLTSVAIYDSMDILLKIHGHEGRTVILWDDVDLVQVSTGKVAIMDSAPYWYGLDGEMFGSIPDTNEDFVSPADYIIKSSK